MPFPDELYRADKFQKHVVQQQEFDVSTPEEYEELADAFMNSQRDLYTWECIQQKRGQRVRYNEVTEELGMATRTGILVTYFRADPLIHRRASNLAYFRELCQE